MVTRTPSCLRGLVDPFTMTEKKERVRMGLLNLREQGKQFLLGCKDLLELLVLFVV